MNKYKLLSDVHEQHQKQHQICAKFITSTICNTVDTDFVMLTNESNCKCQIQEHSFQNLLTRPKFQQQLFKTLVQSAQSLSRSYSVTDSHVMCLFDIDDVSVDNQDFVCIQ
ncbi:Hypothetical_protein [Hexamita inflata]|uniref:Hypothetical_protein n=1 Tax=Hexamita inflata TaxID=28002 RepID=A0AA86RZC9_9EUKA|nr:Hypothetical protein HINF_LOCUS62920 [Hexamita inflata]